jgi:hypothetical protein
MQAENKDLITYKVNFQKAAWAFSGRPRSPELAPRLLNSK